MTKISAGTPSENRELINSPIPTPQNMLSTLLAVRPFTRGYRWKDRETLYAKALLNINISSHPSSEFKELHSLLESWIPFFYS